MDALFAVFGRSHPLLLHVPIGLLVGWMALEALAAARGKPLAREVAGPLAGLAALFAALSAVSGWTLAEEGSYGGDTLLWHRWIGVSLAGCTILAWLAQRARAQGLCRGLLCVCAPLLVLAGHKGATLTHGAGFLTEPLREREPRAVEAAAPPAAQPQAEAAIATAAPVPAPPAGPSWSREIAPILEANCWSCHGASKRKGELALHTPVALLAGGENGPVVQAGAPDASALLARVLLPLDDLDHMPPEGKPQPSADQIALVRAWIEAGASFDVPVEAEAAVAPADGAGEGHGAVPAPDAQAVAALAAELVHVEALQEGSGALWIDFAATAEAIDDAALRRLLEPLREHVVELSLARSRVGDAGAAWLAELPRLRRLDLRGSAVGDAGARALAASAALEELVLAQTAVGDAALADLAGAPALTHLWLWKSAVTAAGLAELRRARPELDVDDGATPAAAALEVEPAPALSGERPVPGETARAEAPRPVNTKCPVSGQPVDARYAVVHEGRVIGFCCPNCPKAFWDDPAKFAAALE